MTITTEQMPAHLIAAVERGELSDDELREIVTWEARQIGLTFDEAVELHRRRALPHNLSGTNIHFLLLMLLYDPPQPSAGADDRSTYGT